MSLTRTVNREFFEDPGNCRTNMQVKDRAGLYAWMGDRVTY